MATEVTEQRLASDGVLPERHQTHLIEATIDTDGSGNGSITIDFNGTDANPFADVPWVLLDETSASAASVSNVTASSVDVDVSGSSTTSGTVTVRLVAHGRQD